MTLWLSAEGRVERREFRCSAWPMAGDDKLSSFWSAFPPAAHIEEAGVVTSRGLGSAVEISMRDMR